MAQMKEQNKTPEKQLSKMKTANLSEAEFKALVIRMFRELIEYGKSIRKEMKALLREIQKFPQKTNRKGKEARIQINDLEHRKK